jgi:hypothetical protein
MAFVQVAAGALAVARADFGGFLVGEVFDALLGAEVELDPDALIVLVVHREGVLAEEMHVAETVRDAAVGHDDGGLVEGLRQHGPEIPVVLRAAHAGHGIALYGAVQVREIVHVAQEEGRRIVADQIPVAFLRVEFDGHAADIALGICRAALAGDGGKADEQVGFFADLGETGLPWYTGDVIRDGETCRRRPSPLACMRRSGMTSRSKCASFSSSHTSCSITGPRGPAVMLCSLSGTGAPTSLVSFTVRSVRRPQRSQMRCSCGARTRS